ncbi:MAG TPA: hypothetical protein VF943_10790 [Burkholderiales bacterium]
MAMNEKYFLVVRFFVAPQAESQLLGWLDGGHMAEVAAQPGFLWCKRIRTEPNAEGWNGYSMIYGIASKAAFMQYENNAALKGKFAKERAPFEKHMKIDRFAGEVVAHA